jgi:histidyl-tRNA synthetase
MSDNSPKSKLMLPKGMRDRHPADKILQMKVLDVIREVYELYGYSPLETPLVERLDVLTAKFAAGEEADVMKEIFQVTDQGERKLGLRFDHTVPLCRYIAMNPNVKMPFKRYVIGKNFRDGPIKLGRYREFWQADADMIGVAGVAGDCEGVMIAAEVFKRLDLDVVIKIGSREILNDMMEHIGLHEDLRGKATISLDKLDKIQEKGVLAEMEQQNIPLDQAQALLKVVRVDGGNQEKLDALVVELGETDSLKKMQEILDMLSEYEMVEFSPTLARGLQYYTGFIYECFMKNSKITSSLIGSGRFDKMIGQFMGGKQEIPGVGLSFGVSVICDALREKGVEVGPSLTQVYVVPVSDNERGYALKLAQQLRSENIRTDMDLIGRSIGKNFGYADTQGIPYVMVIGEDEVKDKTCSLKNMNSGDQKSMTMDEAIQLIKNAG